MTFTVRMDSADPVEAHFLRAHDALGRARRSDWLKRQLLIASALAMSLDNNSLERLLNRTGDQHHSYGVSGMNGEAT